MVEYKTIFSIADAPFDWQGSAILLAFVLVGVGMLWLPGRLTNKQPSQNTKFWAWFLIGGGILFFVWRFDETYSEYKFLQNAFRSGRYEVVEGPVEALGERPMDSRTSEGFRVGSIDFVYSEYLITHAYHRSSLDKGGPIRNGIRARVSYVEVLEGTIKNRILKLEIAEPPTGQTPLK